MPATEEQTRDVATCEAGGQAINTLVVRNTDILIPLEMDVDGDPLQDDQVRLRSMGGAVERVLLASDPDVEADRESRRLFYRFRDVPYGAYRVSVRIADTWSDLYSDLVVRRAGAFCAGRKLDAKRPQKPLAEPILPEEPDTAEGEDRGFIDQVEPLRRG